LRNWRRWHSRLTRVVWLVSRHDLLWPGRPPPQQPHRVRPADYLGDRGFNREAIEE
jgi:hypothetical protein